MRAHTRTGTALVRAFGGVGEVRGLPRNAKEKIEVPRVAV
ncbi:hypothetical protein CBM2615_B10194 [Cupriavidus taiwanensis]|uniref:Uncharacterized protein n=1 Tax=Cupriavidus taiwanensis TaxID=164546 RepID=A0A375E593_9BURK|nr:hypothetical protein CBM2615_B10194 [Cupriavidus taiwanensis]SOZ62235.1 hypothetical protein CBM2614_B10103 [Cupriavidus taiwanensis]SOZ66269.1 hypothetical protein CBM2613_B10195 [Cupriavidus taiwanensis]SPA07500.1 hypothetical protein CBM2625_B10195 [Cupriavidus taiwanensis]